MTTISGVMPVHNEALFLPISLESLRMAPLDELVIILDRCIDNSKEIVKYFKPNYAVKVIEKNWTGNWKNKIAEVTNYGFENANGEIIFSLFADVLYDPEIFSVKHLMLLDRYGMVSFQYYNADIATSRLRVGYEILLSKISGKVSKNEIWKGAIFATKRSIWEKLRFNDTTSLYGEHLQFLDYKRRLEALGIRYKHIITTKNLHLRDTTFTKNTQLKDEKGRFINNYSLWRVCLHSLLHVKPYVLIGYIGEKRNANPIHKP
jgi:glycosyltransferase involved in cell wall biosynthesis